MMNETIKKIYDAVICGDANEVKNNIQRRPGCKIGINCDSQRRHDLRNAGGWESI